ncbi:MAG: hypothetical protein AAF074_21135 [Pseudomonadota bacterium]
MPRFRSVLTALALALGIAGTAAGEAGAQSVRDTFKAMQKGEVVRLTPKSTLVLGGVADNLLARCKGRISLNGPERLRVADFLSLAATRAAVGGRYSDPDLGRALGDQFTGLALYSAAGQAARKIQCGRPATAVLRYIVKVADGTGQSAGRFLESCSPVHGAGRCRCLVKIGQSINPRFADGPYSRRAVYGIIQANPFLGLQVAMKCGIVNY